MREYTRSPPVASSGMHAHRRSSRLSARRHQRVKHAVPYVSKIPNREREQQMKMHGKTCRERDHIPASARTITAEWQITAHARSDVRRHRSPSTFIAVSTATVPRRGRKNVRQTAHPSKGRLVRMPSWRLAFFIGNGENGMRKRVSAGASSQREKGERQWEGSLQMLDQPTEVPDEQPRRRRSQRCRSQGTASVLPAAMFFLLCK